MGAGAGSMDRYAINAFFNAFNEGKRISVFGSTGNIFAGHGMIGMDGDMTMGENNGGGIVKKYRDRI